MRENDLNFLKTQVPVKWNCLTKKLAFRYENFNSFERFQKPVTNLQKEDSSES